MPSIPFVAFLAGAVLASIPPLRQRVLPVTRAVGQAGLGVAAAVLTGAAGVTFAICHGEGQHDLPTA
jgi:hypothetical protein